MDSSPIPFIPWPELRQRLRLGFEQGQHITEIGPTGCGKTVLAAELADLRRYVLVLATKRRDPMIQQLHARGYKVVSDLDEVVFHEDGPIDERIVYWPTYSGDHEIRHRERLQARDMRRAINWVEKQGNWCLIVDEGIWMVQNLGLRRELEAIWFGGRTLGISLLFLAQRPAWVPRYAFSQATWIAVWQTADRDDLKRLSDIAAGVDIDLIRSTVANLDYHRHEFLLINTRTRELVTSIAPPPNASRRAA